MKSIVLTYVFFCCLILVNTAHADKYELALSDEATIFISQEKFQPDKHEIEYFGGGSGNSPKKIDGQYFYGNDFDMPYQEVTDLRIVYNGIEYNLDNSSMYDMWHPSSKVEEHFLLSCKNNICSLEGLFGDAAGSFMARWEFGNGSSKRIILGADEAEMFPLFERLLEAK